MEPSWTTLANLRFYFALGMNGRSHLLQGHHDHVRSQREVVFERQADSEPQLRCSLQFYQRLYFDPCLSRVRDKRMEIRRAMYKASRAMIPLQGTLPPASRCGIDRLSFSFSLTSGE